MSGAALPYCQPAARCSDVFLSVDVQRWTAARCYLMLTGGGGVTGFIWFAHPTEEERFPVRQDVGHVVAFINFQMHFIYNVHEADEDKIKVIQLSWLIMCKWWDTHTHTRISQWTTWFEVVAATLCLLKMSFTEIASHRDGRFRDTTIYGKHQCCECARILNIGVKDEPRARTLTLLLIGCRVVNVWTASRRSWL